VCSLWLEILLAQPARDNETSLLAASIFLKLGVTSLPGDRPGVFGKMG
jgi:hypothetical protein